ncbi:MAG TPA: hypothetical protein VGL86_07545 [Polyangia bacterium]
MPPLAEHGSVPPPPPPPPLQTLMSAPSCGQSLLQQSELCEQRPPLATHTGGPMSPFEQLLPPDRQQPLLTPPALSHVALGLH